MKQNNKSQRAILVGVAAFLALVVFLATKIAMVQAQQSSEVQATLCSGIGPDISVTQPVSDSVVTTPSVTIEGTAQQTSQMDIFINNVYSNSLAISQNPQFRIPLTLAEGTNTIRLEAYFSCNHATTTVSVVVDYRPIPSPSNSQNTETVVPNTQSVSMGESNVSEGGLVEILKIAAQWALFTASVTWSVLVFAFPETAGSILSQSWLGGRLNAQKHRLKIRYVSVVTTLLMAYVLFS